MGVTPECLYIMKTMDAVKGGRPGMILLFFLLTAIPASTGQYFESENATNNCSKGLVFDDMLVSSREL